MYFLSIEIIQHMKAIDICIYLFQKTFKKATRTALKYT